MSTEVQINQEITTASSSTIAGVTVAGDLHVHPRASRKRGAQPRNLNALKHGFYSRVFQEPEIIDLDALMATGLQDEIAMLRVITRRVLTLANQNQDLNTATQTLGALGMAATRLSGLLKTQRLLGGDGSDATRAISEAIASVVQELCLR